MKDFNTRIIDIAAGVGCDPDIMQDFFRTIAIQGRAYGMDIRQITSYGVPILKAIADAQKTDISIVLYWSTHGGISFEKIESGVIELTKPGAIFEDMVERIESNKKRFLFWKI